VGIYKLINGDIYEGDWESDRKCGRGKSCYASGNIFEGDWKDDYRNGHGICKYPNGDVYDGDWKDDVKSGFGVYTTLAGSIYEVGLITQQYSLYDTYLKKNKYIY
jgi:hypothetical protein